jgi:hypothetical protein
MYIKDNHGNVAMKASGNQGEKSNGVEAGIYIMINSGEN